MNVVGIAGQPGFQRGDAVLVDLGTGEIGNLGEEVMPQGFRSVLGHPGGHPVCQNIGDHRDDGRQNHGGSPEGD